MIENFIQEFTGILTLIDFLRVNEPWNMNEEEIMSAKDYQFYASPRTNEKYDSPIKPIRRYQEFLEATQKESN